MAVVAMNAGTLFFFLSTTLRAERISCPSGEASSGIVKPHTEGSGDLGFAFSMRAKNKNTRGCRNGDRECL